MKIYSKFKLKILLVLSLSLAIGVYLRYEKNSKIDFDLEIVEALSKKGVKVIRNDPNKENAIKNENSGSTAPKGYKYKDRLSYFQDIILKNESAKHLYDNVIKNIDDSPESQIIAEYVAEGIMREDTPIFAQYMHDLIEELNSNNKNIINKVVEHEGVLQKNKFQYQMVLNMTYSMQMPDHIKARVLGGALMMPYQFEKDGTPSVLSTNITNALVLMKNSNLPSREVYQYLQKGMSINSKNKMGLKEFQSRANLYFPEMIDVVRN